MTSISSGGPKRWLAFVIVLVLAGTTIVDLAAAFAKNGVNNPTASDSVTTIRFTELNAGTSRLSGLRATVIDSAYTGAQGPPPELLGCTSRIRFTVDGSSPATSNHTVALGCNDSPPNPFPSTSHAYRGTIPVANLSQAPRNGLVRFQIEIQDSRSAPTPTFFVDDNAEKFYAYRLDKSSARMTLKTPSPVSGSSVPDAVTPTNRPSISFRLEDDSLESAIDMTTFKIIMDGVDQTGAFICTWSEPVFVVNCTMSYDLLVQGFTFTDGTHTIVAQGNDKSFNPFDALNSTMTFRVDRTKPVVSSVTVTPNTFTTAASGQKITGRGANVTVTASVSDENINRNATGSVSAFLFNTTRSLVSGPTPMTFDASQNKWVATNVVVPVGWPAENFGVQARVQADDQGGNRGVGNSSAAEAFGLDPLPPRIEDAPHSLFIKDTPTEIRAKVTEPTTESGVDQDSVMLHFRNVTGQFKTEPVGATKITNSSYVAKMNRIGTTDDYTYTLPAGDRNTTINYHVTAKDRAGGPANGSQQVLIVDVSGPFITELNSKEYRGKPPFVMSFAIVDAGSGVKNSTAKLFTSTGAGFTSTPMTRNATTGAFEGIFSTPAADGTSVRYYAEATDELGNIGRFGDSTNAKNFTLDLVAPTVSAVTSPASTEGPTFTVSWTGSDTRSGIDYYILHARVNDGTPSAWITVAEALESPTYTICAEGGHTYEFRISAVDIAGNRGDFPAAPQATTALTGTGCKEELVVNLVAPKGGQTLNANTQPSYPVRWSAASTRSFTPSTALLIDVLFSPDGTNFFPLVTSTTNDGTENIALKDLPTCSACRMQVRAYTLSGAQATASSTAFRLINANEEADLDGNGLPDAWEARYGTLGQFEPGDDDDGDGLTNQEEAALGTDPQLKDTDNDGASDRIEARSGTDPLDAQSVPSLKEMRTQEFTNWYWSVPGLFLAVTILFFVGLARRW